MVFIPIVSTVLQRQRLGAVVVDTIGAGLQPSIYMSEKWKRAKDYHSQMLLIQLVVLRSLYMGV